MKAVLLATMLLLVPEMSSGQERLNLGPRQFEHDTSGKGAVLCAWAIYLSVQTETAACGRVRNKSDDAIDEAIVVIDQFILSNSSLKPTQPMLEDFKRRVAERDLNAARRQGLKKFCELGGTEPFRRFTPEQIRASVKDLLAVPREPVMNPCL